jgi:hypothetical protein
MLYRVEVVQTNVFFIEADTPELARNIAIERAVGRGLSRKSFCPWFVNRGAWVAARGSRFLGDGLRPVVGAQFFADWG